MRAANKKAFENLALAGGFDCFDNTHRAQYFYSDPTDPNTFLEKAIKYGAKTQESENSAQVSLFGDSSEVQIPEPIMPACEEWSTMEKLAKEKEVVGIYISGHPLDDFRFELKNFCNVRVEELVRLENFTGRMVSFGGMISDVQFRTSAKGKDWAAFTIEGYDESFEFRLFNEDFLKFRHFLLTNTFVFVRVQVNEGWIRKDTGERGEPRLQFMEMKLLHEVIPAFAKQLVVQMNVNDLSENKLNEIKTTLDKYNGDKQVFFDIYEVEKIAVEEEIKPIPIPNAAMNMNEDGDLVDEIMDQEEMSFELEEKKEEFRIVNRIEMSSRNSRITISADLLEELERQQVMFKLN